MPCLEHVEQAQLAEACLLQNPINEFWAPMNFQNLLFHQAVQIARSDALCCECVIFLLVVKTSMLTVPQ
jgi:hypothetical protein